MSGSQASLPAYIRLPDGLRFSGAARIVDGARLQFEPRQAIDTLPPEGLPVHIIVAGLPGDDEAHISVEGSVVKADPRSVEVDPYEALPALLLESLGVEAPAADPDMDGTLPAPEEARELLQAMRDDGCEFLLKAMRRFIVELGDHLFDLSTSSRYGTGGQHAHYDALNMLKRHSDEFMLKFSEGLQGSLKKATNEGDGQTFADLEAASARSLDLVALDEMDQKLAVDKIINRLIDRNRVQLECLTIRAALVADLEPRRARTPFHPAYVLTAFVDALEDITDEAVVVQDTLRFFGTNYSPKLEGLYPRLNTLFLDVGVEPGLEEDIQEHGSLLNPVEKRIIKSKTRRKDSPKPKAEPASNSQPGNTTAPESKVPPKEPPKPAEPVPDVAKKPDTRAEDPPPRQAPGGAAGSGGGAGTGGGSGAGGGPGSAGGGVVGGSARSDTRKRGEASDPTGDRPPPAMDRHDAMYNAVLNALDTSRGAFPGEIDGTTPSPEEIVASVIGATETGARTAPRIGAAAPGGAPSRAESGAGPAAGGASGGGAATGASGAPRPSADPGAPAAGEPTASAVEERPSEPLSQDELIDALVALQASPPEVESLEELPPLASMIKDSDGENAQLGRDGANRLSFIDNVFRTLHNNFEVSSDMAPSLARLRVPLARLSLQEPRFFTQPEHPAHQMLDKLSVLASADHTVNRALKGKVAEVVDRVAKDYNDDSDVFAEAHNELDALLTQKEKAQTRNIERVISGLEGQERLIRAQRRVETLLENTVDPSNVPEPLQALLDDGWRSALVQLALREGEESVAWKEESALLKSLVDDLEQSSTGTVPEGELKEIQLRLKALNKRLNVSNPGSVAHETALQDISAALAGLAPVITGSYVPPQMAPEAPDVQRVEQLPRLRRWLQRVADLEPGARLRYLDKKGKRQRMELVWVSEDRQRFAFVNDKGQKVAELTAVQLARQLSRGARGPTTVDKMSVVEQSVYETLEEAQKTLSFDRNRDSLTQLINGDSLMNQLRRTLRHAQARDSEHAYMLLDIDNFGLVNEVFDETSGDQVLGEFARLLGQLNDRRALTARIEEDEFGILLTYRNADDARQVADKIRQDIAASSLNLNDEAVSFTVSIGLSPVTQSSIDVDSIVSHAGSALEMAKTQGRNQVVVYNVDQDEVVQYKREREASRKLLDDAMSTDGLVLRAQPIQQTAVDGGGATHHYEILLSLREDNGDLVSPQDFIMSAERFGFVTLVDRWVLKETFTWISQLVDNQKEVPELSINLSGTSITDNEFLEYVLEQISEYGVGTSKLCFEITETGAIDNLPRAADFVQTLKNIGCKFSLDDFGTGLASHKYLKELPVDYVKIDGTFIRDIDTNRTDYAMTKSINDLAHFLGQKTVAECVENLEVVPALREIGIDYLQGWGIGMPKELSLITDELADLET